MASSMSGRESVTRLSVELQYGHLIVIYGSNQIPFCKVESDFKKNSKKCVFYKNQAFYFASFSGLRLFKGDVL